MPEKKTLNLTSPEALLMIPVAVMLDLIMFLVGVLGDWWGASDYGTIGILGWILIGGWAYIRKGGIGEQIQREEKAENQKEATQQEEVLGSEKMEDWKENKEGVYELKKGDEKRPISRAPKEGEDPLEWAKKKQRHNEAIQKNPKNKQSITDLKVKSKAKQKFMKLAEKYGFGFIVKGVPIVGDFWPGFTIFVIRELRQ